MTEILTAQQPARCPALDGGSAERPLGRGVRQTAAVASLAAMFIAGCSNEPRPEDPYPTHFDYEFESAEEIKQQQAAAEAAKTARSTPTESTPTESTPAESTPAAGTPAASTPAEPANTRIAAAPVAASASASTTSPPPAPASSSVNGSDPGRYLPRATKRDDHLNSILAQPTRRQSETTAAATSTAPPTPVAALPAAAADTLRVHLLNVGTQFHMRVGGKSPVGETRDRFELAPGRQTGDFAPCVGKEIQRP